MSSTPHPDDAPLSEPQRLMMQALDGCLPPEDQPRWHALLDADPALRAEFLALQAPAQALDAFRDRMLVDLHARQRQRRHTRPLALLLAFTSALATLASLGGALVLLIAAPEVHLAVKLLLLALTLPFALAFAYTLRDRARSAPRDRYTEIDR